MKRTSLLFLFTILIAGVFAQAPQVDSLNKVLASTRNDTAKVNTLVKLSFYDQSFQHGLDLATEALALAQKINYEKGEAASFSQIGNQYYTVSNFLMALHYYLEALKIRERINDKVNKSQSYFAIGSIYHEQGDYKNAVSYEYKAVLLSDLSGNKYRTAVGAGGLADSYLMLNEQDSALKYYQKSYEYFNGIEERYQLNATLNGLGQLQFNKGNIELALGYYREAQRNGIAYTDTFGLSYTYLRIAQLYESTKQTDSAIFYGQQSLFNARQSNVLKNVIASGQLLSRLYENRDDKQALHFLQVSLAANDTLFSRQRTMQLQNMLFNETERQKELAEKEKKDEEERKMNLQYALLALGIVSFVIFFLLLSRRVITNVKVIEFLSIVALLIVFEFLNLLLHPYLISMTGHSPVLMLSALVCIAGLLVPLHHRLGKWAKHRLVEKNKQIRLAAAKKTIEQLEER